MKYSGISNFHGGIHPSDGTDKILSNQLPIVHFNPKLVEISMKQAGSYPCKVLVEVGDKVTKGQLIGTPEQFGSANIHASIKGIVRDIRIEKDEEMREIPIVVIEDDEEERDNTVSPLEYQSSIVDISAFSKEIIITSMKECGLIGMGGAGFPTHVKYETPKKIDYVLINAAECEPYLTCDHRLMLEYGYEIINGVQLLVKAAKAQKGIICFEDNKKDAAEYLRKLMKEAKVSIEVTLLPTKYPQGGERQLIEAVILKEVPAGEYPSDIGVIVNNVATAKAIADYIFKEEPLITRCITVTGKVDNPGNYMVPIGTRYQELIESSGGFTIKNNRVIVGGPMTGTSILINGEVSDLSGSVAKTSSGLVVLRDYTIDETPCIKCGECERICPAGLAPFKIDFAAIEDDLSLCDKLYATECISCGSCSYVCPASRELAYRITVAKTEIFQQRREKGGN